jgi:hypothetical protein
LLVGWSCVQITSSLQGGRPLRIDLKDIGQELVSKVEVYFLLTQGP